MPRPPQNAQDTVPPQPPQRRQPKQRRAQQTVEVVLQGAVRVIGREGIDAVTTNRIAEAAGVSIGSLYQYFPDKHAIFEALHEQHTQRVQQAIGRALEAHASSSLETLLLALMDGLIDVHSADPRELHELLAQQPPGGPGLRLALGNIIASKEPTRGPRRGGTQFVVPSIMDVLVHEAVLSRPSGLSLAAAKAEAARAVVGYLRA
jgi:AcrR family transcriptional regulator